MDPIDLPLSEKVNEFVSFVFGGVHHVRKCECMGHFYQIVPWGGLSTYDDDKLTKIVIASHDLGLRAQVDNYGMRGVKIMLHNRASRDGMLHKRHPTMETALKQRVQLEECHDECLRVN